MLKVSESVQEKIGMYSSRSQEITLRRMRRYCKPMSSQINVTVHNLKSQWSKYQIKCVSFHSLSVPEASMILCADEIEDMLPLTITLQTSSPNYLTVSVTTEILDIALQ